MSWSVLIVDDEPMTRNLLRMILSYAGYTVSEAEDGYDALDKIAQQMPDLVLLDLMMPQLDGIDVCKRVRQNETTAHLPIIMLTADTRSDSRDASMLAGADRFLMKPISRKDLLAEIQDLMADKVAGNQ